MRQIARSLFSILKAGAPVMAVWSISFAALGQSAEIVRHRLYYLENQAVVHDLYVNGMKPSRDSVAIEKAIATLQVIHQQIQMELERVPLSNTLSSCLKYFATQNRAYNQLIHNLELLKSSKCWGEFRDVGRFWYKKSQPQSPAPGRLPNDLARAVIQIELLYRVIRPYVGLFLLRQEADVGLFGLGSPVCLTENRDQLEFLFQERLKHLEIVKLLALGKRGVWDVRALSNSLVYGAHEEIDQMQMASFQMIGLVAAAYVAFPYVGAMIQTQLPAYAGTLKTAFWALNATLTLYVASELGTSMWSILDGEKNSEVSVAPTHAAEEFWSIMESIFNLPDSNIALFKMIEQYETELHLTTLKLSPSKSVESWLPQDLKTHGSLEAVIQHYRSRL